MGADIVGWRSCPLQQQEGEDGFFRKLKLLAYKREAERQVPQSEKRASLSIKIVLNEQPDQILSYSAIFNALGDFSAGIPECISCPLAESRPLGCYHYLSFPISAEIEESLADFASDQLSNDDGPLLTLVEKYLQNEQHRALSDGFRNNRGEAVGHLAALPDPLPLEDDDHDSLDSADLLTVLLPPYRDGEDLKLEADVLEAWLDERTPGEANEHHWNEWRRLARIMRAASELVQMIPAVAVLFDA